MSHLINYALGIEIFAVILLIYGLIAFFNVTKGFDTSIKLALYFILASLSVQLVQGATIGILLMNQIDYEHFLWVLYPLLSLVGAFLLVLGSKKFISAVRD